jgi:eukaryotic-like serine/threonine-protein kinase
MNPSAIAAGIQLGPYEIVAPLGSGGMGQVYKARDIRLNRTVALKVLSAPKEWPGARERFKREAETIAGLSHPNICALYDVGEHRGTDFLVMEYLEGETLAACLTKGGLPLERAIRYALEIAQALDKAHRHGIVHRDLKPSNIMVTRTGAKLLDFGLAKLRLTVAQQTVAELSLAPTQSTPLTSQGTLLGTLQYMAPEQLEGQDADVRSDIFAFGTTLYEMVTGRKAFESTSQASLIGAILHKDPPPVSQLQALTPPALDWLIRGCLAKDPDERWQSAHDLKLQIQRIRDAGDSLLSESAPVRRRRTAAIVLASTAVVALLATSLYLSLSGRVPDRGPVSRFPLTADPGQLLALDVQRAVAMSPDGSRLAYVAARRGKTQIFVRPLNQLQAQPLPGTEGGSDPFFSPDGRWLGFSANGQLKKVPVAGGAPTTLAAAPATFGATWGEDDSIIFAGNPTSGLSRIPAAGGTPQPVTALDTANGELAHRWPHLLPGGKAVLFTVWRGGIFDDAQLAIHRLDTGVRSTVLSGGTDARYLTSGHLVYARAATIMAVPFSLASFQVTGVPFPVLDGLETNRVTGAAHFGVSNEGTLAYVPGTLAEYRLVEVDRQGNSRELPVPQRTFNQPRLARDGRRLTFAIRGVDTDIWLTGIDRGGLSRLTTEPGENETPVWSFDGTRVAYSSSRAGQPRTIFSKSVDGSGKEEVLRTSQLASHVSSWSRDGVLAFTEFKGFEGDIWVLPGGGEPARPFLATPFNEHGAMFSPDGRWLAYTSDESGQEEVYLRAYPGAGAQRQISTDGGSEPAWAASGAELFYRNADKMMAVTIRHTPSLDSDAPRLLFQGIFESDHRGDTNYDVTADGQRLVMIKSNRQFTRLNVVLNWFREWAAPSGR